MIPLCQVECTWQYLSLLDSDHYSFLEPQLLQGWMVTLSSQHTAILASCTQVSTAILAYCTQVSTVILASYTQVSTAILGCYTQLNSQMFQSIATVLDIKFPKPQKKTFISCSLKVGFLHWILKFTPLSTLYINILPYLPHVPKMPTNSQSENDQKYPFLHLLLIVTYSCSCSCSCSCYCSAPVSAPFFCYSTCS